MVPRTAKMASAMAMRPTLIVEAENALGVVQLASAVLFVIVVARIVWELWTMAQWRASVLTTAPMG